MILKLENLTKTFGNLKVLDNINIDLENINSLGIIGPSGGGKSTLLRLIAGLEKPTEGSIQLNNYKLNSGKEKETLEFHKNIGVVFQQYNLFPHKTALENVMEGPVAVQGKSVAEAREQALLLLQKVGLGDKTDLYPYQLSGGQQQRVGIARALAIAPELLLFDEPTSALDPELVQDVLDTMKNLAQEGWTMVVVSHEIKFALDVATKVVVMDGGVIVEQGAPEELFRNPQHERTRRFLQQIRAEA